MKHTLITIMFALSTMLCAQDVDLPTPAVSGGMPLMSALNARHSSRDFKKDELSMQQLSNLLWAAFGYNRPDEKKRTAPSARDRQDIEIYVTLSSGVYIYDALNNTLQYKSNADIREATGKQGFVKSAAVNLVFVANYADNNKIDEESYYNYSLINVGFVAQNVYLYCASEGLGTVVRGWYDEERLAKALGLSEGHKILLTQTVGVVK